jgi:formate dehydrogenase iron-sulfur subunit
MKATVYVPQDSGALSLGAEAVATALQREAKKRGQELQLIRNGSRGMYWLEPLLEVVTPAGRVAYGPVSASDVTSLFEVGLLQGASHPLHLGLTEEIPYFRDQERMSSARVGVTDPTSLEDYCAYGGFRGLRNALSLRGEQIIKELIESGLRGRGGAAFPTGIKWKTAFDTPSVPKYVVCNADEGDSGTFSDRMIMEGDPFVLIEGMVIAGIAISATQGYIYLRSEYPHACRILNVAIERAYASGYLGHDVLGSGRTFDLEVRRGAGAYICGEETALLESLEGKRGMIRYRPPLPAVTGLFGQPTIINNVITLASVPIIFDKGAAFYKNYGVGRSRGTLPFQLAGNIKRGGLVEKAFGLTLRELLYDFGGGSFTGRPIRAVQIGGPLGAYLPESQFDIQLDYESLSGIQAMLGHGGVVAFDDTVDMARMARFAMEFCALESCGKCTPCRIGSTRGVEVIDKIIQNRSRTANLHLLEDLCDIMVNGSLCGLGGLIPNPVLSAMKHFPGDFGIQRVEKPA